MTPSAGRRAWPDGVSWCPYRQGTAEGLPFTRNELDSLLELGAKGIGEIVALQEEMTSEAPPPRPLGLSR